MKPAPPSTIQCCPTATVEYHMGNADKSSNVPTILSIRQITSPATVATATCIDGKQLVEGSTD